MRIFVLRCRRGTVKGDLLVQVGSQAHFEIIAHALMNAFYISNQMRKDVVFYLVLESASDFPRTLKFSSNEELSFPGFHEKAILSVVSDVLTRVNLIQKGECKPVMPGIEIFGYGFETLMKQLMVQNPVFLLDKKGEDVRAVEFPKDPVFLLSDHLPMPKNNVKSLLRLGLKKLSLGRKMLFASQCIVLIHNELDRQSNV